MELVVRKADNISLVKPDVGRLDAIVAPALREALQEFASHHEGHFALDLGDISFIDSSGLGALVVFRKFIGDAGSVVLFGMQPPVKNMFKITRMEKVFVIKSDEAGVIAHFSGG